MAFVYIICYHFNQTEPSKSKCFAKVLCCSFLVSLVPWVSLSSLTWNADQDDQGQASSCSLALTMLQVKVGSWRTYHGLCHEVEDPGWLEDTSWYLELLWAIDHWAIETFFCLSMLAVHPTHWDKMLQTNHPSTPMLENVRYSRTRDIYKMLDDFPVFLLALGSIFPTAKRASCVGQWSPSALAFFALSAPRLSISIRMNSVQ